MEDPPLEDPEPLIEKLRKEHALLEAQIEALNSQPWLSAREEMERKRLQKLKLLAKDKIHSISES